MDIQLTGLDPGMGMQRYMSPCATNYVLMLCAVFSNICKIEVNTLQQALLSVCAPAGCSLSPL